MNPRIAELAEQAGLSHMPSNYPDMADLYKGADFELEKFARLIIEECIINLDFHGHVEAASQLVYLKTNRFGIK